MYMDLADTQPVGDIIVPLDHQNVIQAPADIVIVPTWVEYFLVLSKRRLGVDCRLTRAASKSSLSGIPGWIIPSGGKCCLREFDESVRSRHQGIISVAINDYDACAETKAIENGELADCVVTFLTSIVC
jgi:hypothetical protein